MNYPLYSGGTPYLPIPVGGTVPGQGMLANPFMTGQAILTAPTTGTRTAAPLALPPQRVGMNEALTRIGGKMVGASANGGLAAIQAGTDEFGRIEDYNRSRALAEYNAKVLGQYRNAQANKALTGKGKGNRIKQPSPYNEVVIQDIDRALSMLYAGHNWNAEKQRFESDIDFRDNVTGFGAETIGSIVAGSAAADFGQLADTIKSNIGFDRLQKMRDDSPTGGALGQVSEMELRLLNAALGSLAQNQSPEQMRRNLLRVRDQYVKTVEALRAEYAAAGIDFEDIIGTAPTGAAAVSPQTNSSFDEADAIVSK